MPADGRCDLTGRLRGLTNPNFPGHQGSKGTGKIALGHTMKTCSGVELFLTSILDGGER